MSLTNPQRSNYDEDLASKYEIVELLGTGGMGRVLRARHRQLKRWVAIKLLQQDLKASDAITRFLREARAAAQIRSVHVAQVMDAGILRSGQPYIVMEYLQGQDLAHWIAARGRLSISQAVDFTLQALEAIAEAHSLQIVHRDIKPGNLFATSIAGGETLIKVVDFGLAKSSQILDTLDPGVTEQGAVLGTPSYMAPEQFVDAGEVDARADIWGIGASLFEMLTAVPPFRGGNLPQLYTAVMYAKLPSIRDWLPELPEALERVIAKCLSRQREDRFANVGELAAALEPFADASSRWQVGRIQRVLDGARDSAAQLYRATRSTQLALGAGARMPGAPPSPISATLGRAALAPASVAPRAAVRVRRRALGVLLACVVAGWSLWSLPAPRRSPPLAAARPMNATVSPALESRPERTAPSAELTSSLSASVAEAEPSAVTASSPPAASEVAPPAASSTRDPKTKKQQRKKALSASQTQAQSPLYEKYP